MKMAVSEEEFKVSSLYDWLCRLERNNTFTKKEQALINCVLEEIKKRWSEVEGIHGYIGEQNELIEEYVWR